MLNQLQRGDEPALLPCRRSGFLRRPQVEAPLVFDTATAVLLAGDVELRPASLGSREVKGIGPVELFGVEAAAPGQA
jgi:hypothetical protein